MKIRIGLLTLALTLLFSGCSATIETEPASVIEQLGTLDVAQAYIYDSDVTMEFPMEDAFLSLFSGEWTPKGGGASGEKVLSVVVGTQYEICFFDDGTAMIYYGYTGILERDRQYYQFAPAENVEKMVQYIEDAGSVYEETTDASGNGKGIEI